MEQNRITAEEYVQKKLSMEIGDLKRKLAEMEFQSLAYQERCEQLQKELGKLKSKESEVKEDEKTK